jgi:catechol 2,3-dioxygenase-like lactoylglutathione lyase family enzyme
MKIDHITYFGGTREEAKKFYGNILGLETKLVDGKVWVKIGDEYIIHLTIDEEAKTGGKCHFGIYVQNIGELAQRVQKNTELFDIIDGREIVLVKIDLKLKQFFVRDLAGNSIEFISY